MCIFYKLFSSDQSNTNRSFQIAYILKKSSMIKIIILINIPGLLQRLENIILLCYIYAILMEKSCSMLIILMQWYFQWYYLDVVEQTNY